MYKGGYAIINGITSNTTEGTSAGLYAKLKNAYDSEKPILISGATVEVSGTAISSPYTGYPTIGFDATNKVFHIYPFVNTATMKIYEIKVTYNATADKIQTVQIVEPEE